MSSDALPLLSIRGVGKTYAQPVLAEIDLQLFGGEVLALTGENGAGKSTLSKIVGGLERPGAGSLELLGRPYAPGSRREAEALGVRMVMQELNLLPTLSVAENLFLHDLPRRAGWIDRRRLRAAAREAMAQVGLEAIDPDTLVGDLGIGHQQMVEIARNLIGDCRLLILDEPTAMLTAREVDMLFEQVERLRERGVAIVYISHRLEELARISQRIAVLRDGRLVCVEPIERYDADQLVTLMVGRELGERFDLGPRQTGAPLLRVERLSRRGKVHEVSFEVRAGEIFGISGLIGSGRTELLRLIYGADRADGGQVLLGDPPQRLSLRSPADSVRQGVALITEDRKGEGLLLDQSISANLALGNLPALARHGVIDRRREEALARRQVEALRVRCADTAQAVGELSGGNQQKVVIGRWLERDCQVLLFDEPTRGIDVGAKFDIYALLAELTRRGKALVVVSSDLRELMLICDRIGVLSAGRMVDTFERDAWTQDALLAAQLGANLARLHQVRPPCAALDFLPMPTRSPALATIDAYRHYLDTLADAYPVLEWGLRWCELHAPRNSILCLLHRDYRTGNYLASEQGLEAVLDWEFTGWGDPCEDLGWFTARCWRFTRPDLEAGGIGQLEDFLGGYHEVSPLRIERSQLHYWQVMATLRWAVIALQQGQRHLSGEEPSIELALTARLLPELELDILHMTGAEAP